MKKSTVKTKHAGEVEVTAYGSIEEATKILGAEKVLKDINRMSRVDTVNMANAQATRGTSARALITKLITAVKDGSIPKSKAEELFRMTSMSEAEIESLLS